MKTRLVGKSVIV